MPPVLEAADRPKSSFPFRKTTISVGAFLLGGTVACSAVTQWLAYRLDYHPALGSPVIGSLYQPFAWVSWAHQPWAANLPTLFAQAKMALFLPALAIGGFAAMRMGRNRRPQKYENIYGTARFATPADMRESGFLDQSEGVYIGGWKDPDGTLHYLRHNGAEHIAAIAPTRSGKGVGLVVPTLLSWPHSAVIYDEKAELHHLTSGWRSVGADNVIFRWQPGSPTESCAFNFLDTVRLGTVYEVSDAQNIALMLCDPDGQGLRDHWAETAYALITGLILHESYKAKAKGSTASLPDVADALSDPSRDADQLYEEMVCNQHLGGKCHAFVAQEGRAQLNRDSKERTSVHSAAVARMRLFRDSIVNQNCRTSDFRIADLMDHDRPVSLYIVVPGPDKARLRPLVRLMITTVITGLTGVPIRFSPSGQPVMPHKHRLLLMLDEFPSLGRLRELEAALATIAGYGIKAYLIMQDREQLLAAYGRNETVLANCHIQIAYAPNRYETAQWISGVLGKYTANIEDYSESGKRAGVLANVSHSIKHVAKDLMTPEQVMSLAGPVKSGTQIISPGEMLVWAAGLKPRIRGTQALYFIDPVFSGRATLPPPATKGAISTPATRFAIP